MSIPDFICAWFVPLLACNFGGHFSKSEIAPLSYPIGRGLQCSRVKIEQRTSTMLKVAVFISGGGTTLANLISYVQRGELAIEIALVLSSKANVRGLEIAASAGIPTTVVKKRSFASDTDAYSMAMFEPCRQAGVELVVMGGFLQHVLIPNDFENRVINIHPSLIPSFCGQAMYGEKVHRAVLDYGVKVSGCTVHFVNNEYDNGPIILQRTCPVAENDTPASLAARVFQEECAALPESIRLFAANKLNVVGRCVRVAS